MKKRGKSAYLLQADVVRAAMSVTMKATTIPQAQLLLWASLYPARERLPYRRGLACSCNVIVVVISLHRRLKQRLLL
ncbi:hypothetical protein CWC46_04420 [Prodigiosinella confusarubida]|uniref:Uncharacterized protein n=1 Tax=Serratia sp. (strain ATCC 39006) TaxID=104623 RepID=A0A2I5TFV1_SERS3|nr:hypothetical protein CWC46_04420 [Serratia sp. ATCC 39006]AUH03441.1 hypothetical protein Ser39006_004420 [Serratia sp. ATCC 39006]